MPTNETLQASLLDEPTLFRAPTARSKPKRIDTGGGDYGAGLIRSAAIITRGEALGHDMWIDSVMLQQVTDAVNAAPKGIKARFAHPGMSGDGIGKVLGRWTDARLEGDIVRGDLHLFESAHTAPDGNLAKYVMDLAGEDAEAFGASIAFDCDRKAEKKFITSNLDDQGRFVSPDTDNDRNLPHVRLARLAAADVVDSPAANPGGLFHRGHEFLADLDPALEFVLGLSADEPTENMFGVSPVRARGYVARFLAARNLRLQRVPDWRERARERELEMDAEG